MPHFLNRLFGCRPLAEEYAQLELQLNLVVLDLNEASNEINRLKLEATDTAAALRESELARRQLELDLQTAVRRVGEQMGVLAQAAVAIRDLEARISDLVNPPRDPVTKRFVARCV